MPRKSKKRSAEEAAEEQGEEDLVSPTSKRAAIDGKEVNDEGGLPEENEDSVELEEPTSPSERQEDENGEEEEDAANNDEEEMAEDQRSPLRRQINVVGRPAEAGVIKTIYVENFMCHAKLKVDLCRNVNFINGQNGSGKSAILAAIQICLGAGARRTHRARNLKELVRKEAAGNNPNTSAKLRVTLLNEGGDGYKQDVYGDTITVERCISLRGGYNGYKLFDANDKEVSRSKKDLDDMLDHLNIQVENPVAILDQEEAKKFLTGKASEKYAFFMKATELERIDKTFAAVSDRAVELEEKQNRLSDSLEAKAAMVHSLKQKVEEFQAVEKLQKKRLDTEVDYAWAFFDERNDDHVVAVEKMEAFRQKAEAKQLELTQAEEEASGANDADEEKRIREKMKELENEAESQSILKRNLEAELKLAQNPAKQLQRKIKLLDTEKERATKSLQRANKRLKEARDEMMAKAGSAESEEARRTALLNETEEALAQAKAASDGIKESVSVAYQKYEEIEPEVEQAKANAETKGKQVYRVKTKVKDLSSASANDSVAIFGPACSKMHKLVEQAKRNRKFKGNVIGPIGAYLKIAPGKEKYAELAEMAIGHGTLDRFIVTCDHDLKACELLREKAGCQRECGLFQVKVTPRFKIPPPPADDIETIASVLVVSNDIVFNCLVDNARIDQRALAPSKEISEQRLLQSNANGRYAIKGNINEVTFLPKGDKWVVRDGAISLSSNEKKFREKRIGVDMTAAIAEAKRELQLLEAELKELRSAEKELTGRRKDLQREWNVRQREKRDNEDKINSLTRKKEEIENEMETTANTSMDTTELEEDVAQAEEMLSSVKEQELSLKKELEGLEPGVQDVKNRLEEVETRNEKVLSEMKEAQDNLETCLTRLSQSQTELERKREKVKKYLEIIKEHDAKVEKATKERDEALLKAKKLTLRQKHKEEQDEAETDGVSQQMTLEYSAEELEQVEIREVNKDSKSYEAKLRRIKEKITKERERREISNEDPAVAIEKYHRALQDLNDTQVCVDDTGVLLAQMEKDMRDRRKRWHKLHKHLEKMTDSRFDEILQLNKSSGQIEFDEQKNELHLVVQKNINDPSSQTRDVKALSGGERSYTTISLLLALGESLETPFRVLDEFDVFLDTQARKLTIQTLIHVAKKMEHRQFIFITPQDLSSVTPDPKLKIFKMKPPVRKQLAGGPTQQTLDYSQHSG